MTDDVMDSVDGTGESADSTTGAGEETRAGADTRSGGDMQAGGDMRGGEDMRDGEDTTTPAADALSLALIPLFKGVVYRDQSPQTWRALMDQRPRVVEYVGVLGLELMLDEAEGYAYLRHRPREEGDPELPRLVHRRQLSYPVSLLLALLRKKLAEHDAEGAQPRLVLSREQIVDLVRVFLPETANEARLIDRIDRDIKKAEELGFLRRLRGQGDQLEVRRILKSFVDAQWLGDFKDRLAEYRRYAAAEAEGQAGETEGPAGETEGRAGETEGRAAEADEPEGETP